MNAQEINAITEILGHRPTDRVMKIIGDLERLAEEYCAEHPGTTWKHAWGLIKRFIEQSIAHSQQATGSPTARATAQEGEKAPGDLGAPTGPAKAV